MKFLHTADLHIGKKLHEQSLLEDQRFILNQIADIAKREKVDAVVIAGDVYDRAVPQAEAVCLLDHFLTTLVDAGIKVLMISGNHDSPERVAFADKLLEARGLYIAGPYDGSLKEVVLEDEFGPVHFVLMPYVKPAVVGAKTSEEAVLNMLSRQPMTLSMHQRYVMVTHYFVTGEAGETPLLSDSESDVNVGGLDNVPGDCFASFCYTALGHIHRPQRMGSGAIYYSGSPLKYSFSEAVGSKCVNLVELQEPGSVRASRIPLKPLHDLRCIRGRLEELINAEVLKQLSETEREDYLQVTLTDLEELIDPMGTLRSVYPNVLHIILEKNGPESAGETDLSRIVGERKDTVTMFSDFYELLRGETMDEVREKIVREAVWEAEKECDRNS